MKDLKKGVGLCIVLGLACIALYAFIIMASVIAQRSPVKDGNLTFATYSKANV